MKTSVLIVLCAMLIALCGGCGHNAVTYSDGVGVEVGFIPEQYQVAVNFRYGKIFSAVVKEKSEVSLETEAENSAGASDETKANSNTGIKTVLTLKTGEQVTGYAVELEEAKAKQQTASK